MINGISIIENFHNDLDVETRKLVETTDRLSYRGKLRCGSLRMD